MSSQKSLNTSSLIQQLTAGGASLLFFAVFIWVSFETYHNVILLQDRMNAAKTELEAAKMQREKAFKESKESLRSRVHEEQSKKEAENITKMDAERVKAEKTIVPLQDDVRNFERKNKDYTAEQVECQVEFERQNKQYSEKREELRKAEEEATKGGWTRGPDGKLQAPPKPTSTWGKVKGVFVNLKNWWNEIQDKLNKAQSGFDQVAVTYNNAKERLTEIKEQISKWETTLDEKRKELRDKRLNVDDDLRKIKVQMDEQLHVWRTQADKDCDKAVDKLSEQLEVDLKKLEKEYTTKFKGWQQDKTLWRFVSLLHIMTGIYALVLAIRCFVRLLQLRGWCSKPFLVHPL